MITTTPKPMAFERYKGAGVTEFCRHLPNGTVQFGYRFERPNSPVMSEMIVPQWPATFPTPEPFYYGLVPWLWKRLTGWRDPYGRKAQLLGWKG